MNGEIGPVACQNYETSNCLIFVTEIIRAKSKLLIYTKAWLLIINLNEQHAYTFVQSSDIDKN